MTTSKTPALTHRGPRPRPLVRRWVWYLAGALVAADVLLYGSMWLVLR